MNVRDQFRSVLDGMNLKALPLHHPTLQAYAYNAHGKPTLLVSVASTFESAVDGTRGIAVILDPADMANRFLRFQSEDAGFSTMFEAVVTSILGSSLRAKTEVEALDLLLASFEEFRAMFASRGGRLGESGVRGLFAELLMLLELRNAGWSPLSAVNAWQGPYRVAKDFLLPDKRCVEVKSIRRANHRVRIAGVEQLDPRGEDLRLAVITLEKCAPNDGLRLLDLIDDVRHWMSEDLAATLSLAQALSALGVDLDDAYYQAWAFTADDWQWYSVRDDFPRILPVAVPAGIAGVTYTLDIDQVQEFAADAFWAKGD